MIFVEPETAYLARLERANRSAPGFNGSGRLPRQISSPSSPAHVQVPQSGYGAPFGEGFWTEWLLESLAFEGAPMLITTLVNSAVAWGNYASRSAREVKKIELFRLIGKLIRSRSLQRVSRKYVTIPAKNEDLRGTLGEDHNHHVEHGK